MIRKLLFAALFLVSSAKMFAQPNIGIVGGFSSWGNDVVMSTTDNTTFTKTNFFLASGSELKFRQDAAWTTNWGVTPAGNAATPTPLTGALVAGAQNLYIPAGTYDVSINISALTYSFTPVVLNFDAITIIGGFNQFATPGLSMVTADGIAYNYSDLFLTAPGVQFTRSGALLGGSAFPSGTATVGTAVIPATNGYYNVSFTNGTYAYSFIQVPVSLIGSALTGDGTGWNIDLDMDSTDGGQTFSITQDLMAGELKFRANYSWNTNWGGTFAASGTASLNGGNFAVAVPGNYTITFNRTTGEFTFTLNSAAYTQIDAVGDFNTQGLPLVTTDGITYTATDVYVNAAGNFKFVNHNDSSMSWGGTAFPAGTATAGGNAIPVQVGFYNISFNKSTGDYSFAVTPVSMIGAAVGDWSTDVAMSSADNGITFTASAVPVTAGDMKFRSNNSWATSWGGATGLSGVASTTGQGNITIPTAGTYNVSFNRVTGEYAFTDLSTSTFNSNKVVLAYANNELTVAGAEVAKLYVYSLTGQMVKSFNASASYNVSDLTSGIYIVRVVDVNGAEQTAKLAKN